jgi:mutator protein MutT
MVARLRARYHSGAPAAPIQIMNVVAAIIERDGQVLICQRKAGQSFAGKWEFPGGKVEAEEEFKAALARELQEELAITASIGDEVARYEYAYNGCRPLQLIFFQVTEFVGEPVNVIFEQIRWEKINNLPAYDFLDGDIEFVAYLAGDSRKSTLRSRFRRSDNSRSTKSKET